MNFPERGKVSSYKIIRDLRKSVMLREREGEYLDTLGEVIFEGARTVGGCD